MGAIMPDEAHDAGWEPGDRGARLSRREVLAGGLGLVSGLLLGGGGTYLLASDGDPRGDEVVVGDAEELYARIEAERAPVMTDERTNLAVVTWDPSIPGALDLYGGSGPSGPPHVVLDGSRGLMALSRKDPHLGCRVGWCDSSRWFENPCHGERYNRWGEYVDGPAPRGLDRFASRVDDRGRMVVDLAGFLVGPARHQRVLDQPAEGPHCVMS